MTQNFNKLMEQIIAQNKLKGQLPKLLLHSCCAPCSSACLERVKDAFDLTVYYYNPNLDSLAEYELRSSEQLRLCKTLGIKCVVEDFDQQSFLTKVVGLENEPEGGARCSVCYALRLEQTSKYAFENGFDYFTTTLSVSPLKDAKRLNQIGQALAEKYNVKYLPSDFKKQGGYLRSIQLSKQYDLYRQNYCGCSFAKQP